jgi:NHL repeat
MSTFFKLIVAVGSLTLIYRLVARLVRRRLGIAATEIYVADFTGNVILRYPGNANGDVPPVAELNVRGSPLDVAADNAGQIYVVIDNFGVMVFSPHASGAAAPLRTIAGTNTTLYRPAGVAVDNSGRLYVADLGGPSNVGGIAIFAADANGDVAPLARIPAILPVGSGGAGVNTRVEQARGVAVDSARRIYVTDDLGDQLLIFAAGSDGDVAPDGVISAGISAPQHVCVDAYNVYVTNRGGAGSISIYDAAAGNGALPGQTVTDAVISDPYGLAVDAAGRIFVPNFTRRSLEIFSQASGNISLTATIQGSLTRLQGPQAVSVAGPVVF